MRVQDKCAVFVNAFFLILDEYPSDLYSMLNSAMNHNLLTCSNNIVDMLPCWIFTSVNLTLKELMLHDRIHFII